MIKIALTMKLLNLTMTIVKIFVNNEIVKFNQSCDLSQVNKNSPPVTGRYLFTGQFFSPVTGLTCQRFYLSQVVTCSQVNFFRLSQVWPVKGSTCHRSLPVHRSIFSTCHSSDLSQASPVTGRHLLTGRKNLPVTGWPVTCHLSPLTIEIFFF